MVVPHGQLFISGRLITELKYLTNCSCVFYSDNHSVISSELRLISHLLGKTVKTETKLKDSFCINFMWNHFPWGSLCSGKSLEWRGERYCLFAFRWFTAGKESFSSRYWGACLMMKASTGRLSVTAIVFLQFLSQLIIQRQQWNAIFLRMSKKVSDKLSVFCVLAIKSGPKWCFSSGAGAQEATLWQPHNETSKFEDRRGKKWSIHKLSPILQRLIRHQIASFF